ncbi:MAG TPA: DUF6515 family protein [Chitinophagaceae bacterium]|nr:DUF6515 family protein [Chitinophagaceae bacterium]
MNTNKIFFVSFLLFCGVFIFPIMADAQYRRHYERRESYRYYGRPIVSVRFGVGSYGYYSSYAPVYRYYPGVPAFGLRIRALPFGYSSFYIGPDPFYYYEGIYYRPYGPNGYEVTAPPMGARVSELPKNAKSIVVNGQQYYEFNGTYYKEDIADNNEIGYTVVGTNGELNTGNTENTNTTKAHTDEVGDRVDQLPADSKPVVINKQKYYLAPSGIYYQEINEGNKSYYEIVGKSSDLK